LKDNEIKEMTCLHSGAMQSTFVISIFMQYLKDIFKLNGIKSKY